MLFCVQHYSLRDQHGKVLHQREDNHQTINRIVLAESVTTDQISLTLEHPSADVPAALFAIYFLNR